MNNNTLYEIAKNSGIEIFNFCLPKTISQSQMSEVGECYIAIDYERVANDADEKVKLAHEIGHCVKGAFYNRYSELDTIDRHEYRADKWAIQQLIDVEELEQSCLSGVTEVWQLAEHFDVTQEFMQKAIDFYMNVKCS